jgi:hypothetical protein
MPPTRRRRIVRRALWTLVIVVQLPVAYVSSWLILSRAIESGFVNPSVANDARPAFEPILSHCRSGRPGSRALHDLWWAVVSADSVEVAGQEIRSIREAAPLEPSIPFRLLISGKRAESQP